LEPEAIVTRVPAIILATLLSFAAQAAPHPSLRDLRHAGVLPPTPTFRARPPASTPLPQAVGDVRKFWTYDLSVMPPKNLQVDATCRGVGDTVYVLVADSVWGSKAVQSDVDAIIKAFDKTTPARPDQGITAAEASLFGPPPDVDADPHLFIFIYPIASFQGQAFDGFFRAEDEGPYDATCVTNPQEYCSNQAELIHVNATSPGSAYMIGVMAHEYQHLIHWGRDPAEESWLNESMSELAMAVLGYEDTANVHAYLQAHTASLVTDSFVDYGAVMLWGVYVYEQLGASFVTSLVADTKHGTASLDDLLSRGTSGLTFRSLFAGWTLANVLHATPPGVSTYGLLTLPDGSPDGAVPDLSSGTASIPVTLAPTTFRWYAATLPAGLAGATLRVHADPAEVDARVALVTGTTVIPATDDTGTWSVTVPAGDTSRLVVAVANPGTVSQTASVSLAVVTASEPRPEPMDDLDAVDAETIAPLPDVDVADRQEAASQDVSAADLPVVETGSPDDAASRHSSSGGCAAGGSPVAGCLLPLLLMLAGLVLRRHARAA